MILVIVNKERDQKTGVVREIVSHGIDLDTGRNVIMPCETPTMVGARYDSTYGEYVID